jgi:hypothetical protein
VLLVHGAPFAFDVVSEAGGAVLAREAHRPQRTLQAGALRIAVEFRAPDAARDVAPGGALLDTAAAVPWRITVRDADGAVADAVVHATAVVADAAPGVAGARTAEGTLATMATLAASTAARREAEARLSGAVARDDGREAAAACGTLDALQAADEVPSSWRSIAFERATVRAAEAGHVTAARAIAQDAWLPAWRLCDHEEQAAAIGRVRAAGQAQVLPWIGEPAAPPEPGTPAPCDPATLADGPRAIFDAVRAGLEASGGVARAMRAPATEALCAALHDAPAAIATADAAAIGAAARAWMDAGESGLGAATEDDGGAASDAHAFAVRAIAAAVAAPATPGARAAAQLALDRVADAARAAVRTIGDAAGWPPSEQAEESRIAHGRVRSRRLLVGNPFVPAWMPGPGVAARPVPGSAAAAAALADLPTLRSEAARQQARAALIGRVVDPTLAAARERAGRRAVTRRVADEALQAFTLWLASGAGGEVASAVGGGNGSEPDGSPSRPPSGPTAHLP